MPNDPRDAVVKAARALLADEPVQNAANRYPYWQHAMLCMKGRGRGPCDCGGDKIEAALRDLRAAVERCEEE